MKPFYFLLGALALAACAPQEQAFKSPLHEPKISKGQFTTSDEEILPMRAWVPAGKPRAVVVAIHGFNDYSHAFEGTGRYFRKHGIATYAYDQRGFGKAPGRGIWANEKNLTRDLRDFIASVKKRHPHTPVFALGESMGGAVVMRADSQEKLPVTGIVLVSPAVWGDDYMPVFYRVLLWGMAYTLPEYKLTGRNLNIRASNNIEMLREMGRDPLVIKATRVDAIYGLSNLMDDAYDAAPDMQTRLLMLYGFNDQVIPRGPVEATQKRLGSESETIYYDDGYHMLTRDLQGKDVLSDIAGWILKSKKP